MSYGKRFKTLFYRPQASFQETIDNPSLLKTSAVITVSTLLSCVLVQYGMSMCVMAHFVAAYSLMFTMLWLLPTLFSMLIFKVLGKKFSSEAYVESGVLAFFPFFTFLLLYFASSTVYQLFIRVPPRTVYFALVYCNDWLPLSVLGGIGFLWTFIYMLHFGRQVAKARAYQSLLVWIIALAISLYFVYLLFRGWL